jgi:putative FmdB family regulatory protein
MRTAAWVTTAYSFAGEKAQRLLGRRVARAAAREEGAEREHEGPAETRLQKPPACQRPAQRFERPRRGRSSVGASHQRRACYVPPRAGVKTMSRHARAAGDRSQRSLAILPMDRRKVAQSMPLYEYRCTSCKKRVTILTLRASEQVDAVCDRCGARTLERFDVALRHGPIDEARMDALADPSNLSGLDENDPSSVARWMKKMSREMGDEVGGGGDIDEMADEMASGGLAGDSDSGGDDGGSGAD